MEGKKITDGALVRALESLLAEGSLLMGFEKGEGGTALRIFKDTLDGNLTLTNPTFSVNGALYLRRFFSKGVDMLLVLRPCEIRAFHELVKLNQVEAEKITAISVDCAGASSLKEPGKGRLACETCAEKRGVVGDGGIRFSDGATWMIPYTEKGEALAARIEGELIEVPLPAEGGEKKNEKFSTSMAEFSKDFANCILCKNCRAMCPVCYCLDCVFNGDEYLPKGDALLNRVFRSGSTDIPQGKELFHLIRMFHVSQVCVGCGSCEEACPQGIPLTKYFKGISERLQGMFSYMSGRSLGEEIPYLTFQEDELKDAED